MKKGFTLIELLAVIVILAIIALIATPIILNIIKNTQVQAKLRSAENYLEAVEQAIARENLKGEFNPTTCIIIESDTEDGYKIGDLDCDTGKLKVDVDGEKPTSGTITFDKGKVDNVENLTYTDGTSISTNEKGELKPSGSTSSTTAKVDTWDGTSKSTALKGCGTETNPYLIQSAADLIYMRDQVNAGADITLLDTICGTDVIASAKSASYKQTVNIALNDTSNYSSWNESTTGLNSWTPIGVDYWNSSYTEHISNKFGGIYDGDNHTIAGIYSTSQTYNFGLFGFVTSTTIKNLGITDLYVANTSYMGALIGYGYDTTNGTIIDNCYAEGYIKGTDYLGGLIGYFSAAPLTITNSYSKAEITGSRSVGGIVGYPYNIPTLNITNSYNLGNIKGQRYVGGLLGEFIGNSSSTATLSNLYNKGSITGDASSSEYIGGLMGSVEAPLSLSNSYNTGSITGGNYQVGGIIGVVSNSANVTLSKVYNTANISVTPTSYGRHIGGIIGYINSGSANIQESYNKGNITTKESYGIGGIVGAAQYTVTVSNSYNTGNIDVQGTNNGSYYVAGIIGNTSSTTNITNSYNTGFINTVYNYAYSGGIIGQGGSDATIKNAYNIGDVKFAVQSNWSNVGGIAGGSSSIKSIENCHNIGNIVNVNNIIEESTKYAAISTQKSTTGSGNSFLASTASIGICAGVVENEIVCTADADSSWVTKVTDASSMPSVLSVVNGDSKFKEDTNNINNGYPILSWQK